jgi:hypothetical protein
VIVLLGPTGDRYPSFFQAQILRRPDFLLFQSAMEPFDVAVAFPMMIRRAVMRDAELAQRLQEARRCEPRPVVGRQRQVLRAASVRRRRERPHPAISRVRQSITHARCAQPTTRPDLGHLRLPGLIRLGGFHAAHHFFLLARRRSERLSNPRSRITAYDSRAALSSAAVTTPLADSG